MVELHAHCKVDAKLEFFLAGGINYVNNKAWYKCGESDATYDKIKMVLILASVLFVVTTAHTHACFNICIVNCNEIRSHKR